MLDKFFKKNTIEESEKISKNNKNTWQWGKDLFKFDSKGKLAGDFDKAQFLKSVKNFVTILTGKNIPVKYASGDSSYTDGKTVTLSSEVKIDNLDSTIGLALHEGSHIVLTDFNLIKKLVETPDRVLSAETKEFNLIIKDLHNWVEDRRIDNWVYETAPGYRPYYDSLYERYFLSEQTSELIQKKKLEGFKSLKIEDYLFFIINILNKNVKGDEIPGLAEIKNDLINLKDIKRFTDSKDTLKAAENIFKEIAKHVSTDDLKQLQKELQEQAQKSRDGNDGESDEELDEKIRELIKNGKLNDAIKKALEKQRKFGNGNSDKESMSDGESKKISVLANCDTNIEDVELKSDDTGKPNKPGNSSPWHSKNENPVGNWSVITVNKIDFEAIENKAFDIFNRHPVNENAVEEGSKLGRLLSSKLKQRIEERETKNSGLRSGKLDKRLIHSCGYDNERIFFNKHVDKYEELNIHISLDLSGSMSGRKWLTTLTSTVALLTACSKIKNMRAQLSLRYSGQLNRTHSSYGEDSSEKAFVIQFYDSKIDKPSKINWLKYVDPAGCTPEGLCFEALMKKIIKPILNNRTIFINYSDGQPYMGSLSSNQGIEITKQSIKKMRACGVEVLSFFITDGYDSGYDAMDSFKEMYGKDAVNVSVSNLLELAKELNKKFLTKNN